MNQQVLSPESHVNLYSDNVGKTPLHAAVSGVKVEGTVETVNYLLKHGAMKTLNQRSTEEESVSIIRKLMQTSL